MTACEVDVRAPSDTTDSLAMLNEFRAVTTQNTYRALPQLLEQSIALCSSQTRHRPAMEADETSWFTQRRRRDGLLPNTVVEGQEP